MLTFETKRNEILKAMGTVAYCMTPDEARLNALRGKIRTFSKIRGDRMTEGDVDDTARTLDNMLMRHYDSLPLREIELALEWEMVTGESIRLTVHNMLRGIAKYLNSEERKNAFATARKDRSDRDGEPLTPQETNLLNYGAMRDALGEAWETYLRTGRLEPYRIAKGETHKDGWKGGFGDALRGTKRHVYAGCYAWLKAYGVVADDAETKRREAVCLSNARREGADAVPVYAEALMMEWVFSEAVRQNRDLGAEITAAAGRTTEIVRMNTPLRHLQTN